MKKLFTVKAVTYVSLVFGLGWLALAGAGPMGCGALGMTYSLTGMYIEPQTNLTCVAPGMTAQYRAYGSYTEGGHATKIQDISDQVSWSVSLPQLATISSTGLATAATGYIGTTPILATIPGEFGLLKSSSSLQISTTCVKAAVAAPARLALGPVNRN